MDVTVVACGVCGGSVPADAGGCPRCGAARLGGNAPVRSIPPLQPGDPESIGRFRLLGRLGAGGMGLVFLGQDRAGALAAVKVVRPELAGQRPFRLRFAREVTSTAAVSGRYTARVLDHDLDGDTQWVATEYVPGPTLADLVEDRGALPAAQAQLLALGLAEALRSIHGAGLVHRDLKPSNVILAADGPRVIDFGIAQSLDATSLTETGAVVGTLAWLAPEQVTGGAVGGATDVFAWGLVVAYSALGRHPYGQGRPEAIAFRVVNQAPTLEGVPPSLAPAVAAALRPRAEDRVSLPGLLSLLGDPDATVVDATMAARWDATVVGPLPQIPAPPAAAGGDTAQRRSRGLAAVLGGLAVLSVIAVGGTAAGGLLPGMSSEQATQQAGNADPEAGQQPSLPQSPAASVPEDSSPADEQASPLGTAGDPPNYGPLSVGMSIAEAEATGLLYWESDYWGEGSGALANTDPQEGWWVSDDGSVITDFTIKESGWATPEGISVGSSKWEALDAYPGAFFGQENVILVPGDTWGYQFFLEEDGTIMSVGWGSGTGDFVRFE